MHALPGPRAELTRAQFPKACATDCSQTIEVAYLCQQQYTVTTDTYACFCSSLPSDISTCASCLNSNDAAALASLITGDQSMCQSAQQSCFFECSFDTCPKNAANNDCVCASSYLQNIYNCGACNTKNGNTGMTQLSDWMSLDQSCIAQSYAGANASFTSEPLASATGQGAYVAPTLTATGGGEAATGDLTATGASTAAAGSNTAAASAASGTSSTSATRSASSGVASSAASGASAASASASPSSGAMGLAAPALGGVLGLAGAMAALF